MLNTGAIWSRYSLVITPKNWSLFGVNMFVAATGFSQLARIWNYRRQVKNGEIIPGTDPVVVVAKLPNKDTTAVVLPAKDSKSK